MLKDRYNKLYIIKEWTALWVKCLKTAKYCNKTGTANYI